MTVVPKRNRRNLRSVEIVQMLGTREALLSDNSFSRVNGGAGFGSEGGWASWPDELLDIIILLE